MSDKALADERPGLRPGDGEGAGSEPGAISSSGTLSAGGVSPAAPADLSAGPPPIPDLDPIRTGRWPTLTHKVTLAAQRFFYSIDIDPVTFKPQAVFVYGGKEGSDLHALANNVAILISIALQHGATPQALARNLKRPQPGETVVGWPALFVPELIDAIEPARRAMIDSLSSAGLVPQAILDSLDEPEGSRP